MRIQPGMQTVQLLMRIFNSFAETRTAFKLRL